MRLKYLALFVLAGAAFLVAVTSGVRGQNCAFQYQGGTNGSVYPGGTFTTYNTFTNTGSLDIEIMSITMRLDFGSYYAPSSGLPLSVSVGSSRSLYFDIQIPSDASIGDHTLTVMVGFQCYVSGNWITPSESPVVFSSTQTIRQNPAGSAEIAQVIYGVTIAGALVVVGIVVWVMLRRTRASPPPEPSYMPSLPPSETPTGE